MGVNGFSKFCNVSKRSPNQKDSQSACCRENRACKSSSASLRDTIIANDYKCYELLLVRLSSILAVKPSIFKKHLYIHKVCVTHGFCRLRLISLTKCTL